MKVTTQLLKELRELEQKVTPGEWECEVGDFEVWTVDNEIHVCSCESQDGYVSNPINASLIAKSRNALPFLLDEIERLRKVAVIGQRVVDVFDVFDGYKKLHGTGLSGIIGQLEESLKEPQ